MRMKNKNLILIPAAVAERICPLRPEHRLLSAVGQFEPRRMNCWYPVQSYFLTTQSVDEANAVFKRLQRTVLKNAQAMRRFCAVNPEAQRHDFWCPTYDFAYFGAVNNYRLRCMVNHGDFNYFFVVYQKERTNESEAA